MTMQETLTVTLKPLVEEPSTPLIESPGSANTGSVEYSIRQDESGASVEETFTLRKKPRRTSSVTIEEIDVIENVIIEDHVEDIALGISTTARLSTKEEILVESIETNGNSKVEEPVGDKYKKKIGRSVSAPVDNVETKEFVNLPQTPEINIEPLKPSKTRNGRRESLKLLIQKIPEVSSAEETPVGDGEPLQATSATKESIVEHNFANEIPQTPIQECIEKSKSGILSIQKQKSGINEPISDKNIEEATTSKLENNVKNIEDEINSRKQQSLHKDDEIVENEEDDTQYNNRELGEGIYKIKATT